MRRISLLSGLIFLCAGGVAQANAALCKAAANGKCALTAMENMLRAHGATF